MKVSLSLLLALVAPALLRGQTFDIRDAEEFAKIVDSNAEVTQLATGMRFTEGPVWVKNEDGGFLIFSDIPANELKSWSKDGGLKTFREPSNNANGNTLDNKGRLITCEHGARRVSITNEDGKAETLVLDFEDKKLNSPNDAVVKSDGTIWFTDPDYGLGQRQREVGGNYVYRLDPITGQMMAVANDFDKPNGLCFSPNEKQLYIADSGAPKHIRVFDVQKDGALENGRIFCAIDKGGPDGIRCDSEGRVFSSAGDGVHIFAPDGRLIGKILVKEAPANLCFGGPDNKTLFITARTSLYSIPLKVAGD